MATRQFVGIDFGTTNTAVASATNSRGPQLAQFPGRDREHTPTWRTVLYFEPDLDRREDEVSAGALAIERYLANDGDGRLILSIKSYLASALFQKTRILDRSWTLEQLIAAYLTRVRASVDIELGSRAVVGRPVRYWGASDDVDDDRAITRMRAALAQAGFDEVVFEYEPIAAALRYAEGVTRQELVLIADFGGGTSDFSVIRVGPGVEPGDPGAILATGGLGIGGDAFDARVVDAVLAPLLGKGTRYRDEFGAEMTVPVWIYNKLRRWHHLSFLRSNKTQHLLERISKGAAAPTKIAHLRHVIDHDLGLSLHQAIERAKVALSAQQRADVQFTDERLQIRERVARAHFEDWIAPDLAAIDAVVADVLARAGVEAGDIDRVFTTGGSSFVPAVRHRLATRFGAERVSGGNELTSVAWGLAARSQQLFS